MHAPVMCSGSPRVPVLDVIDSRHISDRQDGHVRSVRESSCDKKRQTYVEALARSSAFICLKRLQAIGAYHHRVRSRCGTAGLICRSGEADQSCGQRFQGIGEKLTRRRSGLTWH